MSATNVWLSRGHQSIWKEPERKLFFGYEQDGNKNLPPKTRFMVRVIVDQKTARIIVSNEDESVIGELQRETNPGVYSKLFIDIKRKGAFILDRFSVAYFFATICARGKDGNDHNLFKYRLDINTDRMMPLQEW